MFDGYSNFKSAISATLSDWHIPTNTYFENNPIFLREDISNLFVFVSEICNHLYP